MGSACRARGSSALAALPSPHPAAHPPAAPPSALLPQSEVENWCRPRLRSFPVTPDQVQRYRVAIVVDPQCHA